jgi:hypothetical protein
MKAVIDVRCGNGVWAYLRIINNEQGVVRILNPGNYLPTGRWEYSREAYCVGVLCSYHFLEMNLRTKNGSAAESADISTLADHLVGLPVQLKPGAELVISTPLHEFYDLKRDVDYSLSLAYGDASARVSATTQVRCF